MGDTFVWGDEDAATTSQSRTSLLSPALDDLLSQEHPARFVGAFVDGLPRDTWSAMEINLDGDPLGAPAYHPTVLLNIWHNS